MRADDQISLPRLRAIGRANWEVMPEADDACVHAGYYDRYLVEAFTRLSDGADEEDVADYLVTIETECIGMDSGSGMRDRALAATRAIRVYAEDLDRNAPGCQS